MQDMKVNIAILYILNNRIIIKKLKKNYIKKYLQEKIENTNEL